MNIAQMVRNTSRSHFFFYINIIGLAIGLAVAIMLLLFVVNEQSYNKHFANKERIISLNSIWEEDGNIEVFPINLRKAYTEVPAKVAGIEAATQIYRGWEIDVRKDLEWYRDLDLLFTDPDFFKVFKFEFLEGTPETALVNPATVTLTDEYARIIFGSPSNAINQTLNYNGNDFTVTAVVKKLPLNTSFSFDILANIKPMSEFGGLEYFTFYLIDSNSSVSDVRKAIEEVYGNILSEHFSKGFKGATFAGDTEMLRDLYLHSKADFSLGKRNNEKFVWLLTGLALFILLLAITNFMNLFFVQGENRMGEIGVRKANGAERRDMVKLFFSEVMLITLIAFILGFILAVLFTPSFSELINRKVDFAQLTSPSFILGIIVLFFITVILSASYPSFYLSRLNVLDVLAKRVSFGKRRLTAIIVVFQSVVTIVLITNVLTMNKQSSYMESLPIGYNPKNVMTVPTNQTIARSYEALRQELAKYPEVKIVSGAAHNIGGGCSGQSIGLMEDAETSHSINEYRVLPGLGELMEIELAEGTFYSENDPNNSTSIVINESAAKMLGLHPPYVGKEVHYRERKTIIGVTKDFCYDEPGFSVMPLTLSLNWSPYPNIVYIRFDDGVSRKAATEIATKVFQQFDSEFVVNPNWSEDLYGAKFDTIKTQSKIILFSSLLSILIAALGLLATQSFATIRRTKEISIRRINGASGEAIISLLSINILKWIAIAGVIAIPIAYWLSSSWLANYASRTSVDWLILAIPLLIQGLLAIAITSGIGLGVLSRNPVDTLKTE